jgi:hypothetical protein
VTFLTTKIAVLNNEENERADHRDMEIIASGSSVVLICAAFRSADRDVPVLWPRKSGCRG